MSGPTYNTTVAASRLQKVIDAIDAGAGFGVLVVGTSALAGSSTGRLVVFTLTKPSATISTRTLTFSSLPISATAIASGVAAKAELRDSTGVVVANGLTVGLVGSAADIIVDTTSVVNARPVQLVTATITHP